MITLLELTNIDNTKFLVNQDQVITIKANDGSYGNLANSIVIAMGQPVIPVLETTDQIKALISEVSTATTSVISTIDAISVSVTPTPVTPAPVTPTTVL
jgi:hypothetical protein